VRIFLTTEDTEKHGIHYLSFVFLVYFVVAQRLRQAEPDLRVGIISRIGERNCSGLCVKVTFCLSSEFRWSFPIPDTAS
jgi:hypothetical protein